MRKIFPSRLKALRIRIGKTQEEMSKLLEVKRSTYGEYERGKIIPTLDKMEQIANILEVSPQYLLGWETDSERKLEELAKFFKVDLSDMEGHIFKDDEFDDKIRVLKRAEIWNNTVGHSPFTEEEFEELMNFIKFIYYKRR